MTYEGQWVSRQVCRHGIPFKDGCSDCTHPDDYHYKHTNKSSCVHGVLATVNCWECARELIKKVRVETGTSLLPDPEEHTNKTSGVECEHGVHFQTRCMECYPRPETRCPDCYPSADTSDRAIQIEIRDLLKELVAQTEEANAWLHWIYKSTGGN